MPPKWIHVKQALEDFRGNASQQCWNLNSSPPCRRCLPYIKPKCPVQIDLGRAPWWRQVGIRNRKPKETNGKSKVQQKKFSTICRPLFVSFVRFEVHLYSYGCGLQTVEAITLLVILVSKIASQHAVLLPKSCEFDKTNTAPLNTIKIKNSLNRFFHQLFAAKEKSFLLGPTSSAWRLPAAAMPAPKTSQFCDL